jgi:hypothetical protein
MAENTDYVRLRREAAVPESRVVQARLMTCLSLAACGVVLGALLLMGGSVEREAENFENVWARGLAPAACVPPTPSGQPEGLAAEGNRDSGCVAPPPHQRPAGREVEPTAALAAEPAGAQSAAAMPPSRAPRPPTYIRISKPQPSSEPPPLALDGLRGAM